METASKRRTAPTAGESLPIRLQGLERGWFVHGPKVSPTTFLGAVVQSEAEMNAVIYRIPLAAELLATDQREQGYCRYALQSNQITMLDQSIVPQGQLWIYVIPDSQIAPPNADFPIVQSYVDIVIGGCLEIEKNFALEHFAEDCVTTTKGWSDHWVNDRLYPRRPFIYEPRATAIDQVLQETIPTWLDARKIE
jgi:hypothetical protein